MRAFAYYNVEAKSWVAEAGEFVAPAGCSSADIVAQACVEFRRTWIDDSPRRGA